MRSLLRYLLLGLLFHQQVRSHSDHVHQEDQEYDFIVVGGGTTGLTIANRLTQNSNVRVLVVEVGRTGAGNPLISIPTTWFKLKGSQYDWNYPIEPQQQFEQMKPDHKEYWPKGKVLGGSSATGAMVYHRGSPHDFDSWEDNGAIGWGWKDVEPYFRKLEGASDPGMSEKLGKNGPLKITKRFYPPLTDLLFETATNLGHNQSDNTDDGNGISRIIATVVNGVRQTATAFLQSTSPKRLDILLEAMVTKIVFKERKRMLPRAIGINYVKNGQESFVKARKEVIVCAGAVSSPQLLMLSGIGPKKHLEEMKIKTLVDLPGVGSNLQDPPRIFLHYHTTDMPSDFVINEDMIKRHEIEYKTNGTGPWLSPLGQTLTLLLRTKMDKASQSTERRPYPDVRIFFFTAANKSAGRPPKQDPDNVKSVSFFVGLSLPHPKSTGVIKLASTDPTDHPYIDPEYFSNDDDMKVFIEGIRNLEKFENSSLFKQLGAKMILPYVCKEFHKENVPRSDELYRCLAHAGVGSFGDACCTAKIGRDDDEMRVVDERLRVYGVEGLRVADASVMPHLTSSGSLAACYMIGEKAADLIKKEWQR